MSEQATAEVVREPTLEELIDQNTLETIINDPDIKPSHKLFAAGRAYGVTIPEGARGLGVSREHGYRIDKALSQSILCSPKMLSFGKKAVKTIYERFLLADDPQHNRLAPQVTALVIRQEDAINPKLQRTQSLNVNVDLGMVDYDRFAAQYLGDK